MRAYIHSSHPSGSLWFLLNLAWTSQLLWYQAKSAMEKSPGDDNSLEPFLTNCYVFVLTVCKICQAFKNLMEGMYASHKCLNVFDVIVSSF